MPAIKRPAMPLYIDSWLAMGDARKMKPHDRGIYIDLLAYAWDKGGIPQEEIDDCGDLARMTNTSKRAFRDSWERVLRKKFVLDACGKFVNSKQESVRTRQELRNKKHGDHESRREVARQSPRPSVSESVSGSSSKEQKHTPASPGDSSAGQLSLVSAHKYVPDLESVYRRYPRKEGRKKGLASLLKQLTTPERFSAFERAVANYAAKVAAEGTDQRYMKHFATFAGCWEDYVDGAPASRPARGSATATTTTTREQRSYSTPVEEVLRDYENIDVSPPTAEWREQMERLERRAAIAGDA